jgi:hypothetical protein
VAAMCAVLHEYRPLVTNEGGSGAAIHPDLDPQVRAYMRA